MKGKVCLACFMLSGFACGFSVAPSFSGRFMWGLLLLPVFLLFMVGNWVLFTERNQNE